LSELGEHLSSQAWPDVAFVFLRRISHGADGQRQSYRQARTPLWITASDEEDWASLP
jgi:hypothetical protein